MTATGVEFANVARNLARAARHRGLVVPSFRSPPRDCAIDRSVRRLSTDAYVVAVRIKGRPIADVASDMVEGVIVANRLDAARADVERNYLRGVVRNMLTEAAA